MRRIVASMTVAMVLMTATVVLAQTDPRPPAASPHEHGQSSGGSAPAQPTHRPMMGQGMMCPMMGSSGGAGTGHGMMGAGHGMMGMGPGMMGAMMGGEGPKAQARMLKLRGDMMKAMGEVMLKHAQELEQQK